MGFKRFTDARIEEIPPTAKLVMLAGPNGSGKSSIFDGFKTWHGANSGLGFGWDETYGAKAGSQPLSWPNRVSLSFHGAPPSGDDFKRSIYIRTAFRNEPDFQVNDFQRMQSPLDVQRVNRLIDNDLSVSENFRRMVMMTIDGVYNDAYPEQMTRAELRDRVIGEIRAPMARVFPDLVLNGVGGVGTAGGTEGTFYFAKGTSTSFLYKNLSAGEKAAFDLILDTVVKREFFNDSIWCIDEPETHLNTRVQGLLLETIVDLLPDSCQLFIASHSIGFMRKATEMFAARGNVAFIDLQGADFDQQQIIKPIKPDREFWARTLDVALGDIAVLVAPERVVLCEGRPASHATDVNAAFDASCYRTIFGDTHSDTDFLSVGNSSDVGRDSLDIGGALQTLRVGTSIIRLIDRDYRTEQEVDLLKETGVRVLSRRHLEAYLYDDAVIESLCASVGQTDKVQEALQLKEDALASQTARGKDPDDVKGSAGLIYTGLRRLLSLKNGGSDQRAFARDLLAPLIRPGMTVFAELERDVFG